MIRFLLTMITVLLFIIVGAFVWFVQTIPSAPNTAIAQTDAIIVLTGGNGRVERGLIALADGDAPVLFVSGVGEHVTRRQLLVAHASPKTRARITEEDSEIVLDYVASTTRSNADQAAEFVRERNLQSIRLITAAYHMPRSLLEFHLQMPDVEIIPDPVFPETFHRHNWWQDKSTRSLVISEFWKYFAALFLRNKPIFKV